MGEWTTWGEWTLHEIVRMLDQAERPPRRIVVGTMTAVDLASHFAGLAADVEMTQTAVDACVRAMSPGPEEEYLGTLFNFELILRRSSRFGVTFE